MDEEGRAGGMVMMGGVEGSWRRKKDHFSKRVS